MNARVRSATKGDLDRINEIYNTYIVDSHVVFDVEPWDLERRHDWWQPYADGDHIGFVGEVNGDVVGVAYTSPRRERAAYDSSVQTTVVLDEAFTRKGIGTRLLTALLDAVVASGAHRAYDIVALPNDASVELHERLGFRRVGLLDEVGRKMGRYWSTMIEKRLDDRVG